MDRFVGTPRRRSTFLIVLHFITGGGGLLLFIALAVLMLAAFIFTFGRPVMMYSLHPIFGQYLGTIMSIGIIVITMSGYDKRFVSFFLAITGILGFIGALFERTVSFIYGAKFGIDCYQSSGSLTASDFGICTAGDPVNGPIFALLAFIINIVLALHVIVGLITFLVEIFWTVQMIASRKKSAAPPMED